MLKDLVPTIRKTVELVQEVTTASREQGTGVYQVNQAMIQVDRVTQTNAAAAEELTAQRDNSRPKRKNYRQLVSSFRIHAEVMGTARSAQPAAAQPNHTRLPTPVRNPARRRRRTLPGERRRATLKTRIEIINDSKDAVTEMKAIKVDEE